MAEEKVTRLNKILRELNISLERAVDYLKDKGHEIEASPNTKVTDDIYTILSNQFSLDKDNKNASSAALIFGTSGSPAAAKAKSQCISTNTR